MSDKPESLPSPDLPEKDSEPDHNLSRENNSPTENSILSAYDSAADRGPAVSIDTPELAEWEVLPATDDDVRATRQPLKILPKHGVCLWWPDDFETLVHPDDLKLASELVPSDRILEQRRCDDEADREAGYVAYHYNDLAFRARPSLWVELQSDGYLIGDQVQLRSEMGKRRPIVSEIIGIFWHRNRQRIEYTLSRLDLPLPKRFVAKEFRLAPRIGTAVSPRERALLE